MQIAPYVLPFANQRLSLGVLASVGPVLDTAVWEVGREMVRETQLKLQIVRQSTVQAF